MVALARREATTLPAQNKGRGSQRLSPPPSLEPEKQDLTFSSPCSLLPSSLLLGRCKPLVDLGPVHHVPPCFQVLGTQVLIFQVIGMLPDVVAEDRVQALGQRRILVSG